MHPSAEAAEEQLLHHKELLGSIFISIQVCFWLLDPGFEAAVRVVLEFKVVRI